MKVKCKECGKEFTDKPTDYPYPGKVYQHHGEAVCESCLIGMGVLPDHDEQHHQKVMSDSSWFYLRPY